MRKTKWYRFLANFPLGMLVGSILAFLLAWLIDASLDDAIRKFYTFMLSAVLSLFAASMAIAGSLYNASNQNDLALTKRTQKVLSSQAQLSAVLSRLIQISENAIELALATYEDRETNAHIADIALDIYDISVITAIIENTTDTSVARRLAGILTEHQIFYARLRRRVNVSDLNNTSRLETIQSLTEWVAWNRLAITLFEYARGETQTVSKIVTSKMILSELGEFLPANLHIEEVTRFAEKVVKSFSQKRY